MSLIAFASAKGAPGVTTAALAVGALWPRRVLVADLDPAGGDIALRLPRSDGMGLDPERGVIALASAARRGLRPEQIPEQTQTVVGGLDVLVGVRSAEQGEAVAPLWPILPGALDALPGVDVIADCGRLGIDGRHDAILRAARHVVLFCRPNVSSVMALRERVGVLAARLRPYDVNGTPIGIVVVADDSDGRAVAGVRDTFARLHTPIPVIGHIAFDPKGAAVFDGQAHPRPHRTMLVRSARALTSTLAAALAPYSSADDAGAPLPVAPGAAAPPVGATAPDGYGYAYTEAEFANAQARSEPVAAPPSAPTPDAGDEASSWFSPAETASAGGDA